MNSKVFVQSLEQSTYAAAISAGLDYIQFGQQISPNSHIFIKPNLTFPEFRPGVMTNPEAVEAAICAIRDYTPNIYMGDSDSGGYNRFSMDQVYETTGIHSIAKKYDVKIVNLSKVERRNISFQYRGRSFSLALPTILMDEMDHLITMPVPKVHANTGVSLTFKNQWGCIPENTDRLHLHPYFKHVILEVNRAVHADFAIIDGKWGLTDNGPMKGRAIPLNWVLVSNSIGSGAQIGCDLMGVQLEKIVHKKYAKKMGFIPDRKDIEVSQDISALIREPFKLKRKWTDWPGYLAFYNPWIAYLAYFSPLAGFLHKLLYLVREPFYDHDQTRR